jgi:hypothetical protein
MVYPLTPWTWEKASILKQLDNLATQGVRDVPRSPPPEEQYLVTPVPYQTGFKAGQLVKINFPLSSSKIGVQRTQSAEPLPMLIPVPTPTPTVHISSFI